jgi:chaperonin GroES
VSDWTSSLPRAPAGAVCCFCADPNPIVGLVDEQANVRHVSTTDDGPRFSACRACLRQIDAVLDRGHRGHELASFNPLSDGLLLELDLPPEKIGHVLLPDSAQGRKSADTWFGRVRAIGPGFLQPNGRFRPLQVRLGDRVCFPAFLGHDVKLDERPYRLVYERDVCAREPGACEERDNDGKGCVRSFGHAGLHYNARP